MGSSVIDVAIIGAGPYGLSLGAHLKERGVPFRIFGQPMQTWREMPRGMYLKSLGFATNVYTPDRRLGFVAYCKERALESNEPCAIADFARYGVWVQEWLLPELEKVNVAGVSRSGDEFKLSLADGRTLHAKRVVLAVGTTHFARMPNELAALPPELASHTSQHRCYDAFAGKDVCVVGAGQSAFEAARLLVEAGARPHLLVRDSTIGFSEKMRPHRSWWERIRRPQSGLGPGLKNWILENFPLLLHFVPNRWRLPFVKSHLGPHGAWWLRERIEGKVPVLTNCTIIEARPSAGRLALQVRTEDGERSLVCDHAIVGTGYEVDVDKLDLIDPALRRSILRLERGPALDFRFQSSVPGLYFIGLASSLSFGPLFRFVVGAAYTSRALGRELCRRSRGSSQSCYTPPRNRRRASDTMRHAFSGQELAEHGDDKPAASPPNKPRLLLIATMPWMFPARLAGAFRNVGFHVEAVCQLGHPLRHLNHAIPTHRLGWIGEAASIETAIHRSNPDLLIPCDDPAVQSLHHLHQRDGSGNLARLIEKSLGDAAGFCVTEKKSALIAAARSMGLRAPRTECIANRRALSQVAARATYPSVLKRDQTWSGIGVTFVQSEAELPMAWSWIAGWISILRAVKAVRRDRRPRTLLDVLANRGAAVELQEFVAGTPANRAVLCRDGRVVAGLSVLALQTAYPGGPASVVRVIDHPEMTEATEALVRHLGLSGFCGFDFVISPSGQAYLLELNPRATPVSHLALADDTHLPAALYRELTGNDPACVAPTVPHDLIALFPTEWQRDRSGASLHDAHHDAPWDEPALLAYAGIAGNEASTASGFVRRKLHSVRNA